MTVGRPLGSDVEIVAGDFLSMSPEDMVGAATAGLVPIGRADHDLAAEA